MTNTSYYFAYMLDTISIDHYNQSNPVNTASFFQQRKISFEARSDLDIAWKPVEYKTDVGWITESIIQDLYYQLDENLIQIIFLVFNFVFESIILVVVKFLTINRIIDVTNEIIIAEKVFDCFA